MVLSALIQFLLRVKKPYMITVKGMGGTMPRFSLTILTPYIGLIGISLGACWFYLEVYGAGHAQGYLFFALKGALVFLLMLFALVGHDLYSLKRSGVPLPRIIRARGAAIIMILSLTAAFVGTAVSSAGPILQTLFG
jgi:cellulose synthase (UDP-forming)